MLPRRPKTRSAEMKIAQMTLPRDALVRAGARVAQGSGKRDLKYTRLGGARIARSVVR
jgi:hypothetical protein